MSKSLGNGESELEPGDMIYVFVPPETLDTYAAVLINKPAALFYIAEIDDAKDEVLCYPMIHSDSLNCCYPKEPSRFGEKDICVLETRQLKEYENLIPAIRQEMTKRAENKTRRLARGRRFC